MKSLLFASAAGRRASCAAADSAPLNASSLRFRMLPLLAAIGLLGAVAPLAHAVPTVYTIGDSTVQIYTSGYYPRTGWGQVLPKFFDSTKVTISDKAVGGTSSKSFYDTYWAAIRDGLKAGDYVTIQFGINDSATDTARHTDPFTTFETYLTDYVNETRAKGAFPILVATQNRNAWNADSTIYPAYHDYPVATRDVASQLSCPLIDLDQRCKALLESVGPIYSTYLIYNNYLSGWWANYPSGNSDNVHFQEMGATEMARLVVAGIRALSTDANVSKLIPFLVPTYTVTFTSSNGAAGVVTRTTSYPAGATVTAQAWPYAGYSFTGWSGSITGSKVVQTFTMGTSSKTITATFSGSTALYPAENGTRSGTGTVVETTNTGYHGSGYVNFPTTGGSLTFNNVSGGAGGQHTLRFRYALGATTARTGNLVINGTSRTITFNPTGAWTTWVNLDIILVGLNSGSTNTIQLQSTGSDLGNVDELTVL